jgi:ribulose-phosphate 3-epimerase
MKTDYLISASILSADFTKLGEEIAAAEQAGCDWIHVDVMDGHFVPNLTMGPLIVEACRRATDLPLDVHLMIENPEKLVKDFVRSGADTLAVHVELGPKIPVVLNTIRELGCRACLTLNPDTPAEAAFDHLHLIDQVLVMTVHPGYSGQDFMPGMIEKVARLREEIDRRELSIRLEVDGGIGPDTIPGVLDAGADTFVAASAIFTHPEGIAAGVASLRDKLPASASS